MTLEASERSRVSTRGPLGGGGEGGGGRGREEEGEGEGGGGLLLHKMQLTKFCIGPCNRRCVSVLLFSLHSLEVLNDCQDHLMCPLHNRREEAAVMNTYPDSAEPFKEVRTDLNDVNAVEWVDQEEPRGPVHLVPALTAGGQLLVVGCANNTRKLTTVGTRRASVSAPVRQHMWSGVTRLTSELPLVRPVGPRQTRRVDQCVDELRAGPGRQQSW